MPGRPRTAGWALVNDASNRAVLGTLPAEQAEQRGHVLSKVRVDAHGAQHHDVAAIATLSRATVFAANAGNKLLVPPRSRNRSGGRPCFARLRCQQGARELPVSRSWHGLDARGPRRSKCQPTGLGGKGLLRLLRLNEGQLLLQAQVGVRHHSALARDHNSCIVGISYAHFS
jgi:hypothetical protein